MSGGHAIAAVVAIGGLGGAVYLASKYRRAKPAVTYVTYQPEQDTGSGTKNALFGIAAPFISAGIDSLFSGDFGNIFGGKKSEPVGKTGGIFSGGGAPRVPTPTTTTRGNTGGGATPLHDLIGSVEAPKGYNQVYGGIRRNDQPPKPLTSMTVNEVLAWQDSIDTRYNSEAAGRYQIMEDTLRGLKSQGKVGGNELFNEATQDRLATTLMERRGLNDFQAGRISQDQFAQNLSMEWASLPAIFSDKRGRPATGQSYYAGDGLNRSHLTRNQVLASVRGLR